MARGKPSIWSDGITGPSLSSKAKGVSCAECGLSPEYVRRIGPLEDVPTPISTEADDERPTVGVVCDAPPVDEVEPADEPSEPVRCGPPPFPEPVRGPNTLLAGEKFLRLHCDSAEPPLARTSPRE